MSNNKLSAFIALWDKELGVKIIDFYPKSINRKKEKKKLLFKFILEYFIILQ